MKLPYFVYDILKTLQDNNYDAFVVGGACRNYHLNTPISDFDVTTNCLPENVEELFREKYTVVETGLKHGTVSIVNSNKRLVEVTTFRKDSAYDDNRHPNNVEFVTDYKTDALRRDFTINAIYYDVKSNSFLDPVEGLKDLFKKTIKCIGNPDDRFNEDALRILRAIRFEACLEGFTIDEETYQSILRNKELLKNIAFERIREEFNKILLSGNVEKTILKYFDIFTLFIPELEACKDFNQKSRYHKYDVLVHILKACDYVKPQISLKLAALFHDVGKPLVAKVNPKNNRLQFINHEASSAELAVKILNRLHYDSKTIRKVDALIKVHDRLLRPEKHKDFAKLLNLIGKYNIMDLIELKRADDLAHKDDLNLISKYDVLYEAGKRFLAETEVLQIKELKINGDELVKLGFVPGKIFKTILMDVFNSVVEKRLPNDLNIQIEYVLNKYGKRIQKEK